MATRGAGTLVTTYTTSYIPPALMPGYCGYIPNRLYTYGDTIGNAGLKYFQDFRSAALNSSKSPYYQGGHFPTLYSNNPDLVIGNRSRGLDRWLHTPNWYRFNVDFDRMEELNEFYKLSQKHRDQYLDRTDTIHKVPYFILPVKEKDRYIAPYNIEGAKLQEYLQNVFGKDEML
uniref:Ciliary microtubule inner protein 2C n=1 Tax=Geotrypetes seraphini TaxID=260995 RepID=A0A6P8QZ01_GEOSA|nr:protein FAM166C [Geotrypetes seraphini]